MSRPPVIAAAAAVGVLALVGCGTPPHYTLSDTRACLKDAGAVIVPPKDDFVAETATAGAFRAELDPPSGNAVTLSFGESADDAKQTAAGYVRFHAKNVGVSDILEQDKNVVLLWKQHPTQSEQDEVTGCLK